MLTIKQMLQYLEVYHSQDGFWVIGSKKFREEDLTSHEREVFEKKLRQLCIQKTLYKFLIKQNVEVVLKKGYYSEETLDKRLGM